MSKSSKIVLWTVLGIVLILILVIVLSSVLNSTPEISFTEANG